MNSIYREKREIRCVSAGIISGLIIKSSPHDRPTKKIIVLHGWLDNLNSMVPLAEKLAEHHEDYELFLFDSPGHGQSSHFSKGVDYGATNLIQSLREIVENLGWTKENYALIGHSYGAMIIMIYAACFSDEVSCVVAIDALPRVEVSPEQFWKVHGERIDEQIEFQTSQPRKYENRLTLEKAIDLIKETRPGISDAHSRLLAERSVRFDSKCQQIEFTRDPALKMRGLIPLDENLIRSLIVSIQVPVLLIGSLNPHWPRPQQTIDLLQEYNENFEMTLIDGPHHLHLTHVDEVAQRIDQYLNIFLFKSSRTSSVLPSKL